MKVAKGYVLERDKNKAEYVEEMNALLIFVLTNFPLGMTACCMKLEYFLLF
jgi:hypothetical protein